MKLVGVSGYVHTVEDSSCACMKIIPGSASVHSVNQSINQSIYVYTWDGVAPIIRAAFGSGQHDVGSGNSMTRRCVVNTNMDSGDESNQYCMTKHGSSYPQIAY